MADAVCAACNEALVYIHEADNEEDETTVPDSVQLHACGCRFHWQCLMDRADVQCPACGHGLIVSHGNEQVVMCTVHNEGGLQEDENILQQLHEEHYFKLHPEEREARALWEFCSEGDVDAVLDLLVDRIEDDSDMREESDQFVHLLLPWLLRYRNPFENMQSALIAAIAGGHEIVAWLLLYVASDLSDDAFPLDLVHEADARGLERGIGGDPSVYPDIRTITDAEGRSARDMAMATGGNWLSWIEKGRFPAM